MSATLFCLVCIAVWAVALSFCARLLARNEVRDYYELQVSKAAHPAGKAANRQTDRN